MTIRTILVDDEPLAIQGLELRLEPYDDVEIIDTCSNGREAIRSIKTHKPDLVFLDIQMPALTGFEVAEAIGADELPATIFVTAFDQFALKAFDIAAVDYLVKPFDDERFQQALRRARRTIELNEVQQMTQRLADRPAQPEGPAGADGVGRGQRKCQRECAHGRILQHRFRRGDLGLG